MGDLTNVACTGYEGCIYCRNGVCIYNDAEIKVPLYMACNADEVIDYHIDEV